MMNKPKNPIVLNEKQILPEKLSLYFLFGLCELQCHLKFCQEVYT